MVHIKRVQNYAHGSLCNNLTAGSIFRPHFVFESTRHRTPLQRSPLVVVTYIRGNRFFYNSAKDTRFCSATATTSETFWWTVVRLSWTIIWWITSIEIWVVFAIHCESVASVFVNFDRIIGLLDWKKHKFTDNILLGSSFI